jgi:hypothetical protein
MNSLAELEAFLGRFVAAYVEGRGERRRGHSQDAGSWV